MILLLDLGNSRIKWRAVGQGRIRAQGVWPTHTWPEDAGAAWTGLGFRAVLAADVADAAVRQAVLARLRGLDAQLHWLTAAGHAHGIVNHYQPAESLGADRYAALVAAHRHAPVDWLVVSAGTALTVDMLTAEGHFLGGCILPGPDLMRAALAQGTAGVRVAASSAEAAWPVTTATAVGLGIGLAAQGVVQGLGARLEAETRRTPRILLSGGARAAIRSYLPEDALEVDELVLEGLTWIARDLGYDA